MGTGILSLPLAGVGMGLWGIMIPLLIAGGASYLIYLALSELTRRSNPPVQLLTILERHLFTGRWAKVLRLVFFGLFTFVFFQSLVTYVVVAGQALSPMTGWPVWLGMIIFTAVGLGISLLGIMAVTTWESVSVGLIAVTIATLSILSLTHHVRPVPMGFNSPWMSFGLFTLFMYAFSAIFAVVQVASHVPLAINLKAALGIGLAINMIGTLCFMLAVTSSSDVVTPVGSVGLAESLGGPIAMIAAGVFVILAMITSYWPSLIAFADIMHEAFAIKPRVGQLTAAIPSLLIAIFCPLTILDYIKMGAGAISLIIIILIIPAYHHAIRLRQPPPLIGKNGREAMMIITLTIVSVSMLIGGFL